MLMQSGNPLLMGVGLAGSIMSSLFDGQRQQPQVEGGGVSRGQAPGSSFVGPVDSGAGGQVPVVAVVGGEQQNGGQGGDPGRSGNPANEWGQWGQRFIRMSRSLDQNPNRPANPPDPFLNPKKIIPYQNPGPGVYYSGFKGSSVGAQAPQAPANRPGMIWAVPPSGQQPPQAPQSKQRVQQPQQQPQQPAKQPQQKVQQPPQQQPVQPRQTQPQKQSQQTQQPRQQPQSAGNAGLSGAVAAAGSSQFGNAPQRGKANASDLSGGDYSGEQYSPTEGAISGGSGVDTSSVMKQILAEAARLTNEDTKSSGWLESLISQLSQLKQSMGGDASGSGSGPETSGSARSWWEPFGDNEVYSGEDSEEAPPTDPGLDSMFSALGLM